MCACVCVDVGRYARHVSNAYKLSCSGSCCRRVLTIAYSYLYTTAYSCYIIIFIVLLFIIYYYYFYYLLYLGNQSTRHCICTHARLIVFSFSFGYFLIFCRFKRYDQGHLKVSLLFNYLCI
jgi:hypothetical protein